MSHLQKINKSTGLLSTGIEEEKNISESFIQGQNQFSLQREHAMQWQQCKGFEIVEIWILLFTL